MVSRAACSPTRRPNLALDADGRLQRLRSARDQARDRLGRAREQAFDARRRAAPSAQPAATTALIPVSGGKDSTWQVVKCLEHGLNPLAVTWRTPARTAIGAAQPRQPRLASASITSTTRSTRGRGAVHARDASSATGDTGDPDAPGALQHPADASRCGSASRSWSGARTRRSSTAAPTRSARGFRLDDAWLRDVRRDATARRAADWVADELTERDLTPYFGPTGDELEAAGVLRRLPRLLLRRGTRRRACASRGDTASGARPRDAKTGYYDYADIDDDFISHPPLAQVATSSASRALFDNLSLEIRNGRMTRDAGDRGHPRRAATRRRTRTSHQFCALRRHHRREHFFEIAEHVPQPRRLERGATAAGIIDDFLIPDWEWT